MSPPLSDDPALQAASLALGNSAHRRPTHALRFASVELTKKGRSHHFDREVMGAFLAAGLALALVITLWFL